MLIFLKKFDSIRKLQSHLVSSFQIHWKISYEDEDKKIHSYDLNLLNYSCTCPSFLQSGLTCKHVMAFLISVGIPEKDIPVDTLGDKFKSLLPPQNENKESEPIPQIEPESASNSKDEENLKDFSKNVPISQPEPLQPSRKYKFIAQKKRGP